MIDRNKYSLNNLGPIAWTVLIESKINYFKSQESEQSYVGNSLITSSISSVLTFSVSKTMCMTQNPDRG